MENKKRDFSGKFDDEASISMFEPSIITSHEFFQEMRDKKANCKLVT